MAKKTIKEIIQSVRPGKVKSMSLDGIDVNGFRQEATRLNQKTREEGVIVPDGKPHYTISVSKRAGCLFIINNMR